MQAADYFPSKVWPLHIQRMRQFLVQHDQLLLVLGETGTGKSSLLKHFYDLGNMPGNCMELKGKSTLQPQKLTRQLCKKWHLDITLDQTFRQHQLDDILSGMKKFHQPGLLIIDDAHLLPIATLAALMHLCLSQDPEHAVLRIILLGQNALSDTMCNLHSPDVVIPTIQLQPLTLEETKRFVEHILDQMGLGKTRALKEPQIEALFEQSKGIAANTRQLLAQQVRHEHTGNNKAQAGAQSAARGITTLVQQHWIKLLCLGMLGTAFLGMHQYQQHMNSLNQLVLEQRTPMPVLAHYTPHFQPKKQVAANEAPKAAAAQATAAVAKTPAATAPTATPTPKLATQTVSQPAAKATSKPAAITTAKAATKHIVTAATHGQPAAVGKPITATKAVVTTIAAAKPIAANPKFVIQLMGDYNKSRVVSKQKKLAATDTSIRHERHQQKDWYTLTVGGFEQYSEAKQAMANLPKKFKAMHPWIKPLSHHDQKTLAAKPAVKTTPLSSTDQVLS